MKFDVVIVGGGPAGLSAALGLGRSRRRVLLADGGPRRNAAAVHMHNFVTRDGTPPEDFRRIGREQLRAYPSVDVRDEPVLEVSGERGAFDVKLPSGSVLARRILLATGMIDEPLALEGYRELWGRSIFQCPYCHGWEIQDRPFAFLVPAPEMLEFALLLRGWSRDVLALTNGAFAVPAEVAEKLARGGVRIEERKLTRLVAENGELVRFAFETGPDVPASVLFSRPPQRQVDLVRALGLALDPMGFVQVEPMQRETSVPGIFAGGDLTTPMQAAIIAAGAGMQAAAMINHGLIAELALAGELPP